jgi:hypothetical protein
VGIAEHDLVAGAREERSEFASHQSGTEDADSHGLTSSVQVIFAADAQNHQFG